MKSGKCPKCQSVNIYTIKGGTSRSYGLISQFSRIRFTDYICTDCGFCENYVEDSHDKEKIKTKGKKGF